MDGKRLCCHDLNSHHLYCDRLRHFQMQSQAGARWIQ
jgi:hypothetical protein